MPDTWVVVLEIPNCDLCGPKSPTKAYADGKLNFRSSWANMCRGCFGLYGTGLGLGMGQELLLEPPNATA